MKNSLKLSLFILITLIQLAARADEKSAPNNDLALLQGQWSMAGGSAGGQILSEAMLKNSKRLCKGEETTVSLNGQLLMQAKFSLLADHQPKWINYQVIKGANTGKTQLGIYEFDGETVKFCFASPGMARPTDFSTKAGDGRLSSVWRHNKPKAGA